MGYYNDLHKQLILRNNMATKTKKKTAPKNKAKALLWKAGITYAEAKRLYGITANQLKTDTLTDAQVVQLIEAEERNHD